MNTLGGGPPARGRGRDGRRRGGRGVQRSRLPRPARRDQRGDRGAAARIIPGAGGDELIRLVTALAVGPGMPSSCRPRPSDVRGRSALAGGHVVEVPRAPRGAPSSTPSAPPPARRGAPRLALLPNNPTGDLHARRVEALATASRPSSWLTRSTSSSRRRPPARAGGQSAIPLVDRLRTCSSCAPSRRRTASPGTGRLPRRGVGRGPARRIAAPASDRRAERPAGARGADDPARPGRHEVLGTERARVDAALDGSAGSACHRSPTSSSSVRRTRQRSRDTSIGAGSCCAPTGTARSRAGCASPSARRPRTTASSAAIRAD